MTTSAMRIRNPITFLLLFALAQVCNAQPIQEVVAARKYSIRSEILDETREYWVSLPESYDLESYSQTTYPLLVVLDGGSHFRFVSGMLDFMSASRSGSRRVPEMIVVGVASTNRERDFTPDKIVTRRENDTGGGDKFLDFLENELVSVLREEYRVGPYSVLMGHSLGGLLAAHTYLKPETIFNAFVVIDPSFGTWDADTMDEKVSAVTGQSFSRFLYVASANWGTRNLGNRDRHVRFFEALHRRTEGDPFRGRLEYFENENHGSVPLIAFYNGMSAVFEGYGMTDREVTSLEQVRSRYEAISSRLSHNYPPPEELVSRVGYRMLRSDDGQQEASALGFFKMNATNYPESAKALDSLGEAYAILGEKMKAVESFQKSLKMNPGGEYARSQLEILGAQ